MDADQRGFELLRKAGWTPDRSVDVRPSVLALEEAEVVIWDGLVAVLRSYSGLRLEENHQAGIRHGFWFDGAEVAARTGPLPFYERYAETILAPVGMAQREHMLLVLGRDGRIYGADSGMLWLLGNSVSEGIARAVDGPAIKMFDIPAPIQCVPKKGVPGDPVARALGRGRVFGHRSNKAIDVGRKALNAAGWSEGRNVDVSRALGSLEAAGYPMSPGLVEFLASFSGITVGYNDFRTGLAATLWIDGGAAVDLEAAVGLQDDPDRLPRYEQGLGRSLTPIGAAGNDELLLLFADDGSVFGEYQGILAWLGSNLAEAVGALIDEATTS